MSKKIYNEDEVKAKAAAAESPITHDCYVVAEIDAMYDSLDSAMAEIVGLSSRIMTKNSIIGDQAGTIFQNNLRIGEQSKTIAGLMDDVSNLRLEYQDLRKAKESYHKAFNEKVSEVNQLGIELKVAKDNFGYLEAELNRCKVRSAEYFQKAGELETLNAKLLKENLHLNESKSLAKQNAFIRRKFELLSQEKQSLHKELQQTLNRYHNLAKHTGHVEEANDRLFQENRRLKESINRTEPSTDSPNPMPVSDLHQIIADLQRQLDDTQKSIVYDLIFRSVSTGLVTPAHVMINGEEFRAYGFARHEPLGSCGSGKVDPDYFDEDSDS